VTSIHEEPATIPRITPEPSPHQDAFGQRSRILCSREVFCCERWWVGWLAGDDGVHWKEEFHLERTEKSEVIILVKRKTPSNAGNQNIDIYIEYDV